MFIDCNTAASPLQVFSSLPVSSCLFLSLRWGMSPGTSCCPAGTSLTSKVCRHKLFSSSPHKMHADFSPKLTSANTQLTAHGFLKCEVWPEGGARRNLNQRIYPLSVYQTIYQFISYHKMHNVANDSMKQTQRSVVTPWSHVWWPVKDEFVCWILCYGGLCSLFMEIKSREFKCVQVPSVFVVFACGASSGCSRLHQVWFIWKRRKDPLQTKGAE